MKPSGNQRPFLELCSLTFIEWIIYSRYFCLIAEVYHKTVLNAPPYPASVTLAIKNKYLNFSTPCPAIVEPLEHFDEEDGMPEKLVPKVPKYYK